jgi:carbon storage regulator CsrA
MELSQKKFHPKRIAITSDKSSRYTKTLCQSVVIAKIALLLRLWHIVCIDLDTSDTSYQPRQPEAKECAMLVLTRKLQEKIHIGENITITVVRIQGNTVRVGIEAPGDVRVVRGEVMARDEAELAAAEAEPLTADEPLVANVGDTAVVLRRKAPLARITAGKTRLRLAVTDGRPALQPPLRDACAVAGPAPALTC